MIQTQQELIQFADSLQSLFEIAIVFERPTNLLGTQAHLAGLSAGVAHPEDPEGMALTTGAFQTSRGVMDDSLEQRATKDPSGRGEFGCESVAFASGLLSCHH